MGYRDSKYQYDKIVELNEGFFEIVQTDKDDTQKAEQKKGVDLVKSKPRLWL